MKKIVAVVLIVLLAVIVVRWLGEPKEETVVVSEAPQEDVLDVVLEFYNDWLDATVSTTTDIRSLQVELLQRPVINETLRASLLEAQTEQEEDVLDPVLCQPAVPKRVGGKILYLQDTNAQIMILTRGGEEKSPYQAVVSVQAVEGKWQINKINCTQGETAPEREFDFERSGFLLKSVPPPLNPEYWHLVYEENGVLGHTVPLFFSAESICVATDGTESVCDESQFTEASEVYLQAGMTEAGATVQKIEFR